MQGHLYSSHLVRIHETNLFINVFILYFLHYKKLQITKRFGIPGEPYYRGCRITVISAACCVVSIYMYIMYAIPKSRQSMDCPTQIVDPRFAQTIHGLSQALHDELNTYPKPLRLQYKIFNAKYKSLTSPSTRC